MLFQQAKPTDFLGSARMRPGSPTLSSKRPRETLAVISGNINITDARPSYDPAAIDSNPLAILTSMNEIIVQVLDDSLTQQIELKPYSCEQIKHALFDLTAIFKLYTDILT